MKRIGVIEDDTLAPRSREDPRQERINVAEAVELVQRKIRE